jgi:hypothetical protein
MFRKLRHFAFPRWIGHIITKLANCAAILTHALTYRPLWAFNYPIVSTSHSGYMSLFFIFSFRFATHLVPPYTTKDILSYELTDVCDFCLIDSKMSVKNLGVLGLCSYRRIGEKYLVA